MMRRIWIRFPWNSCFPTRRPTTSRTTTEVWRARRAIRALSGWSSDILSRSLSTRWSVMSVQSSVIAVYSSWTIAAAVNSISVQYTIATVPTFRPIIVASYDILELLKNYRPSCTPTFTVLRPLLYMCNMLGQSSNFSQIWQPFNIVGLQ